MFSELIKIVRSSYASFVGKYNQSSTFSNGAGIHRGPWGLRYVQFMKSKNLSAIYKFKMRIIIETLKNI